MMRTHLQTNKQKILSSVDKLVPHFIEHCNIVLLSTKCPVEHTVYYTLYTIQYLTCTHCGTGGTKLVYYESRILKSYFYIHTLVSIHLSCDNY